MVVEKGLSKNEILTELTKSAHGRYDAYLNVAKNAAKNEPEFLAHLISWDRKNGQLKDTRVALPIISLATPEFPDDFIENSLAHLVALDPRLLVKALRYARGEVKIPKTGEKLTSPVKLKRSRDKKLKRVVERYLKALEARPPRFDQVALQHRGSLKELYILSHVDPGDRARAILFGFTGKGDSKVALPFPKNSVFEAMEQIKNMSAQEAAGTIFNRNIPFLIAMGALGERAKEKDVLLALINAASATELTTNAKWFEERGVTTDPVLKIAWSEAMMKKVVKSGKSTLKTTKAAEAVTDERMKQQLHDVQEKQIENMKGIEGNWLVLGDRSPSMSQAIEVATEVSAHLARFVTGKVLLVFFDGTVAKTIDATGKTLEELKKLTKHVTAGGAGTSIGCGLVHALDKGFEMDGIAIVSDGEENHAPTFAGVYAGMVQRTGKQVPVYYYRCAGSGGYFVETLTHSMAQHGLQTFDLRGGFDYYSLPNLIQTMRANRYSLVDEIMETDLLTLEEVLRDAA